MIMKKFIAVDFTAALVLFCIFGVYAFKPFILNNINLDKLMKVNMVKSEQGNKLNTDKEKFVPYKVKKGDTVYGICAENVISFPLNKAAEMIINKNHLKGNDDIKEGQVIYIPYMDPGNSIEYLVKEGDTIFTIARQLMPGRDMNISVEDIMEENNLSSDKDIREGQILLIPYDK